MRISSITRALLLVATVGALAFAPAALAADNAAIEQARTLGHAFSSIAKEAGAGVVSIQVEKTVQVPSGLRGFNLPGFPGLPNGAAPQGGHEMGQGSGFFVSPDGIVLTNHHVIDGADKITLRLRDGRELKAEVVGSDPESDVAVLRAKDAGTVPYLQFGDSDALQVGEWVLAIGNPFGLQETVTAGIVSAKGRNSVGISRFENFIQTDAAINPGNSGGPLLNLDGKVVGINSAIFSRSGGNMGIGFAIPAKIAESVRDQLLAHGKVERGFLGVTIQDLTPDLANSFDTKVHGGALVSEVSPDSPADKAGLHVGDVITGVEGQSVPNGGALRNAVGMRAPGTQVTLALLRDGKPETVKVTLGDRATGLVEEGTANAASYGLEVVPLTDELAARLGRTPGHGVVIRAVQAGSPAEAAGLEPGQVIVSANRKPVATVADFARAVRDAKDHLLLRVLDDQGARFVVLEPSGK